MDIGKKIFKWQRQAFRTQHLGHKGTKSGQVRKQEHFSPLSSAPDEPSTASTFQSHEGTTHLGKKLLGLKLPDLAKAFLIVKWIPGDLVLSGSNVHAMKAILFFSG